MFDKRFISSGVPFDEYKLKNYIDLSLKYNSRMFRHFVFFFFEPKMLHPYEFSIISKVLHGV